MGTRERLFMADRVPMHIALTPAISGDHDRPRSTLLGHRGRFERTAALGGQQDIEALMLLPSHIISSQSEAVWSDPVVGHE